MKKRIATLVGGTLLVGLSALGFSSPGATSQAGSRTVRVHCRSGNNPPFVTPNQVHLAIGDTLVWAGEGMVVPDSITISLKNANQAWPFPGNPPRGGSTVAAPRASARGTYPYNATIKCRIPGGGQQWETIDPDIIID